jgi:hypothetical protein
MGMFPLLLSNEIEWAKEAVALGAILQASDGAIFHQCAVDTAKGCVFIL